MAPRPVIIKKYENRRLYDSTNSRYINQDEVASMIRAGHEVQVLDAATGEDLTRLVLTQIIVEDAKGSDSTFPLDILRQMVVASGKATQENTLKYMKAVLDMYQNAYRALTPPLTPFEFMPPRSDTSAKFAESRSARENGAPAESAANNAQELQQRVEELEALVAKMTRQQKTPGKARAKVRRKR